MGNDKVLVDDELKRAGVTLTTGSSVPDSIKTSARNRYLAFAFLRGADRVRYGRLQTDLENQYTRGNDQYPIDITSAYNLLVNYCGDSNRSNRNNATNSTPFSSSTDDTDGTAVMFLNSKGKPITCFKCGRRDSMEKGRFAISMK